jgi:hypothetical protein
VPTASFAESLGESLTKVIPDAGEESIKPEIFIVKADKPDQKRTGNLKEHPVEPGLPGPPKSITKRVVVLDEKESMPVQGTNSGMASDEIPPAPVQNDAPEKVSSDKVLEIPKPGGQPVVDRSTEMQAGESAEQEDIPRGSVVASPRGRDHREADSAKTEDIVRVSGSASGKVKEVKISPHHKAKRDSEELAAKDPAVQQNSPTDSIAMVQTVVPAAPVPTGTAISQAEPNESPQFSSVDVKQLTTSGRKVLGANVSRNGQPNQAALKQPHGSVNTTSETSGKTAEAPVRDGKTVADTTVSKADADGNRPQTEDKVHTAMQAAPAAGTSGLQPQLHEPAIQSPDKVAVTAQVHLVHKSQSDTPVPQTIYAPGEHGMISATPTALEVGVPGGTHGWLKVRAELGGDGTVHASMSSNSATGTEALRRELPQLTSYLHQEQVRVSSVVVHAPHNPAAFSSQLSGDGGGQAMNGGSPDAHRGDTGHSDQGASHSQTRISQTALGPEADGDLLPRGFGSAGGWLSVRA